MTPTPLTPQPATGFAAHVQRNLGTYMAGCVLTALLGVASRNAGTVCQTLCEAVVTGVERGAHGEPLDGGSP